MTSTIFLTTEWQNLAMINYEIDPTVLNPFIPAGTELDLWHGKALVSLVGLMFLNTRVQGFAIPFNKNFEEVNLRFYVKRTLPSGEVRRGVAFIKEIVPRRGIAFIARLIYNENYVAFPMQHLFEQEDMNIRVEYRWKIDGQWNKFRTDCQGFPKLPSSNSEAEFITEHYWGYSVQKNGETLEYQVEHSPWRIWEAVHFEVAINATACYGENFTPFLEKAPVSVFLAEGSDVTVYKGTKL